MRKIKRVLHDTHTYSSDTQQKKNKYDDWLKYIKNRKVLKIIVPRKDQYSLIEHIHCCF